MRGNIGDRVDRKVLVYSGKVGRIREMMVGWVRKGDECQIAGGERRKG